MSLPPLALIKTAKDLLELCQPQTSKEAPKGTKRSPEGVSSCQCTLKRAMGWTSVSEGDWPAHFKAVATLRDPEVYEPTFEEHHPCGTHYDSADAPIALGFFPTNRCTVYECTACKHFALRYTEFGGYYVDPRARLLNPQLIVKDTIDPDPSA